MMVLKQYLKVRKGNKMFNKLIGQQLYLSTTKNLNYAFLCNK